MSFFSRGPELQLATEYPPADEQQHIDSLIRELRAKMQRDYAKTRTLRDAHPKMHGCVRGEFSVAPDLPKELSIGVFQTRPDISGVGSLFQSERHGIARFQARHSRGRDQAHGRGGRETDAGRRPTEPNQDFILISDSRFVTKNVAEFDGLVKALVGGVDCDRVVFSDAPSRAEKSHEVAAGA